MEAGASYHLNQEIGTKVAGNGIKIQTGSGELVGQVVPILWTIAATNAIIKVLSDSMEKVDEIEVKRILCGPILFQV